MYSEFYGFSDRPFQLTPDARFYFGSRTHKKAMAYLGYGLAQGEGFIVITGDVGAGKSTLVAHLMATIDRSRLNAINIVSTQVEGDDMLRLAAQGMGLFTEGVTKAQLLERVERHLEDEARHGKRTLLIVDEAQNLSVSALEELRMLSNFQVSGQALLQIFLLGQPEFREKMATESLEQLRQRVIATHHLEPMEPSEVEPYIIHRLKTVGWEARPLIEIPAFAEIYRHTRGVPRKVNQFAGRLLLHAAVEELDAIDADTVLAVAEEMEEDAPRAAPERVQPQTYEPVRDLALERRVAMLESQLEEQERAVRRVLTLLVDWVESEEDAVIHHAA
jgi:putative secretion ATPase (PEP-CTERM system associated)